MTTLDKVILKLNAMPVKKPTFFIKIYRNNPKAKIHMDNKSLICPREWKEPWWKHHTLSFQVLQKKNLNIPNIKMIFDVIIKLVSYYKLHALFEISQYATKYVQFLYVITI
jgi:hypothetical protein